MSKNDLVYYIHDGSAAFRLQLSGDLSGEGVRDLEQTWRTASSVIGERRLVVDLSLVTGVDLAGRELLEAWQAEGAWLVATTKAERYTWPSLRLAARWAAAFVMLLFPATVGKIKP